MVPEPCYEPVIRSKEDKLSLWLQKLIKRRGFNVAAVALANKNARILWALAHKSEHYEMSVSA